MCYFEVPPPRAEIALVLAHGAMVGIAALNTMDVKLSDQIEESGEQQETRRSGGAVENFPKNDYDAGPVLRPDGWYLQTGLPTAKKVGDPWSFFFYT